MPRSSQRKLLYIFRGLMVLLFIYGCFLPENWREAFGLLARPIAFAAEYVPAIHKAVGTAQAVRPELGYGFLGMAAYIPLIFTLYGNAARTGVLRLSRDKYGRCGKRNKRGDYQY